MLDVYITVEGDTFDSIALRYYRNERLASLIMRENPDHHDTLIFEAGISLRIPEATVDVQPSTLPPWRRDV